MEKAIDGLEEPVGSYDRLIFTADRELMNRIKHDMVLVIQMNLDIYYSLINC